MPANGARMLVLETLGFRFGLARLQAIDVADLHLKRILADEVLLRAVRWVRIRRCSSVFKSARTAASWASYSLLSRRDEPGACRNGLSFLEMQPDDAAIELGPDHHRFLREQ